MFNAEGTEPDYGLYGGLEGFCAAAWHVCKLTHKCSCFLHGVGTAAVNTTKYKAGEPLNQPDIGQLTLTAVTYNLSRYKEGELNVGENSCVDRCSSKYWAVTGIVGQLLGGNQQ